MERVVPKTVVEGFEAYAFAREAPRPRVAPTKTGYGQYLQIDG